MLKIEGLGYGFGLYMGKLQNLDSFSKAQIKAKAILTALILPNIPALHFLNDISLNKEISLLVIPYCSPYSHSTVHIWKSNIPIMSVKEDSFLPLNSIVLADFEKGEMLIAETETEVSILFEKNKERIKEINNDYTILKKNTQIELLAEVCSSIEIKTSFKDGANGLGVIKADNLINLKADELLDFNKYTKALKKNSGKKPFLVRFFDQISEDDNRSNDFEQYLNYRGIRLLENSPYLFEDFNLYLKRLNLEDAIVILPMVTSLQEIIKIKTKYGSIWKKIGITVETPAAALKIKSLLKFVDFVEIGLNDLTQYTMAWNRDIPNKELLPPTYIAEPVFDLISMVVKVCNTQKVPYTLGLDLKPNKYLLEQLINLNVRSISCLPPLVKHWKALLH